MVGVRISGCERSKLNRRLLCLSNSIKGASMGRGFGKCSDTVGF